MRRAKAFSTVNWRKYLDVKTNPRAKSFLESRGNDVLWQIATNIDNAIFNNKSELVLLVHPNAGAVIRIKESEYIDVLTLSLKWFEHREDYEKCRRIQSFLENLDKMKKGLKITKNYKETIV